MPFIRVTRMIDAPAQRVFETVADVTKFTEALPHATGLQFLTDQKTGVGTRFRQTRAINGKESTTELEITELKPNQYVRMVSDTHGTVWDTLFTVQRADDVTVLTAAMEATAHKLLPRLIYPFIKGMIRRAMQKDLDLVKSCCESVGD